MPTVAPRPPESSQSKNPGSNVRDPSRQDKKSSSNVDSRPWTLSRFSRTMSRIFRLKGSHRKSKSNSMRSRSVYFTDFPDRFGVNTSPDPLSAMRSPIATSPQVASSHPLPLPPTMPTRTGEATTSTSSALLCHDAVQTNITAAVPPSAEVAGCSSPAGISCVHHVHHIHHVHHVHHHLHHMPPPPPLPPAPLPSPGTLAVTSSQPPVASATATATDDAAALIMMLETAATLGETPPPLSMLMDAKSTTEQQQQLVGGNAGNSHTYSSYGVRGGAAAGPCCPIASSTPPPPLPPQQPSAGSNLHRQNTVCSNPRCITAHCRPRVQGSPCDHLRTPTSIELAELAEAGAEAVFANGGRTATMTTTTTTSSGSFVDPLLSPSPPNNASAPNSPAPPSAPLAGIGSAPSQTHLMHHMHHHHMHHMLHRFRPPSSSSSSALANATSVGQSTATSSAAAPPPVPPPLPSTNTSVTTADNRSSFQESMKALRKMGWYWGPLSFTEAEKLLANRPDGTFLVRDSAHDTFFLSLSFRVRGTTYHTRIEHNQGRFSFWFEPESHSASTVVEFIEKAVAHSIGGKYHYFLQTSTPGQQPVEVSLLYPLSRFQVVQSLKHLARFTILSHVRRDHVARLPLPPSQIGYLLEKQVYWESLEDFEEAIRDRPPLQFSLQPSPPSSSPKP